MEIQKAYDEFFMQYTISLAEKGWGRTGVNPLVGAVITKNNKIVGQGYHRKIGEAHAEVCALINAGNRAENATLYVNLEPCCCAGRTPPCVEAIRKAGIRRVVIGTIDPNPSVNGKGVEFLRKNNIDVILNILNKEAKQINLWYKKYITKRIPYIILKIAISMDGKISGFKERYITSEPSRRYVHSLRSQVGSVLVGIDTVVIDNPYLTDRFVGRNNPARVVIDPHLRIPLNANFLHKGVRRIIVTKHNNDSDKIKELKALGVEFLFLEGDHYPLPTVIEMLGNLNIGSIMVEGGGQIFSQFLSEGLYDELYFFVAQKIVGKGLSITDSIVNEILLKKSEATKVGEDLLYHVYRNN